MTSRPMLRLYKNIFCIESQTRECSSNVVDSSRATCRARLSTDWYRGSPFLREQSSVLKINYYAFLCVTSLPSLLGGQLLLELHNPLALLPVAILRSVPMNLLAIPAAVAVRLALLTELAIGAVQRGAANLTALSKITQMLLEVRNGVSPMLAI